MYLMHSHLGGGLWVLGKLLVDGRVSLQVYVLVPQFVLVDVGGSSQPEFLVEDLICVFGCLHPALRRASESCLSRCYDKAYVPCCCSCYTIQGLRSVEECVCCVVKQVFHLV
jgi:hypothetical protein